MPTSTKRDSNAHRVPPNTNPNSIDFIHLRYQDSKGKLSGQGGITIAYRRVQDSPDKYEVAIARCRDTDNFCRKIGRNIASGFLAFNNLYIFKIEGYGNTLYARNTKTQKQIWQDEIRARIIKFVIKKTEPSDSNKNPIKETPPSLPQTKEGQTLH